MRMHNLMGSRSVLKVFFNHVRFCSSKNANKVCIVGSGPAGFYTAQRLLMKSEEVEVDMYEKLPIPYGLIRYGVAPDHPEVRCVVNIFSSVAMNERCRFHGNVAVGKDVTIPELLKAYHAVVLAHGAHKDRTLGIPGEKSKNVFTSSDFVGWYNGLPKCADLNVDMNTEVAAVIGNGNVALDVARILLLDTEKLKSTDIADYAYEALKNSRIRRVVIIGRRGPMQVAFTAKEIREIKNLSDFQKVLNSSDFEDIAELLPQRPKIRARAIKILMSFDEQKIESDKKLEMKFFRTPQEIISDETGKVSELKLRVNKIDGSPDSGKIISTEQTEALPCGLIVSCIGYECQIIDPFVPFDNGKKIVPNVRGKVTDRPGLYCSGWVKTGPIGTLSTTLSDSQETAHEILTDLKLRNLDGVRNGHEDVAPLLKNKGIKMTSFKDWQKIDKIEQEEGEMLGKERKKVCSIEEMLKIAGD